MKFENVEVLKTIDNMHYVTWDFTIEAGDTYVLSDYDYVVYWSNDPDSGYQSIKDDNGDEVRIDGAVGPLEFAMKHSRKHNNFNNNYYYEISAYNKTEPSDAYKSNTAYIGDMDDGIHTQIKYAESLLYDMYYGEPTHVLKRKTHGERCTNCWSETRQQRTKSNCSVCDNTGFVNGYYKPIDIQISFDSDPVVSTVIHDGERVADTKRGRMSNYPLLRPRDMIINGDDNKHYSVTHIETTKLPLRSKKSEGGFIVSQKNHVVSQILTMQEIPADDQEYYIDIANIIEGGVDYSLPRFQTHEPVRGAVGGAISVDDNQVISLRYGEDFTVNGEGYLEINDEIIKSSILSMSYLNKGGVGTVKNIPPVGVSVTPGASILSKLTNIVITAEKSDNILSDNASITVSQLGVGSSTIHNPETPENIMFTSNFGNDQVGAKFYPIYNIDCGGVILDSDSVIFVDINPNNGWTFDDVRITINIELTAVI